MLREPSEDLFLFFDKLPAALPLFEALDERIAGELGASTRKVQRTQITYKNRYNFACISLPVRRVKGWPEVCIIVTFGLGRRLPSARIAVATEPYLNFLFLKKFGFFIISVLLMPSVFSQAHAWSKS